MDLLRWTLALIGHLGLWSTIFNLIHSTALPRSFRKRTEKAIILAVTIPVVFVFAVMLLRQTTSFDAVAQIDLARYFLYTCVAMGVFFFAQWAYRKLTFKLPSAVVFQKTEWLNLKEELGKDIFCPGTPKLLGQLPFNECLQLTRNNMTFKLDLPTELSGLKICHLSDLHFTGHINVEFFQRIVQEANSFEPDLIFITGDLVDEVECLPWLEITLGRLRANFGVYYVLGNHDLRVKDETGFRRQLRDIGLIQASGKWHEIKIGDATIRLTGTEMPWYDDVTRLGAEPSESADLKICLSHSPDQKDWAKPQNFDLMFAGHTHGGQVALPLVGPLVAPSKYGVRYASGTFQIDDMILHVSRGLSGDEPIRLCCPPELGLFTLKTSRTLPQTKLSSKQEYLDLIRRDPKELEARDQQLTEST